MSDSTPPLRTTDATSDSVISMHYGRIGTPLAPHATRVMLLGSGELGKEVIIAFQRLGVEVIAVDRYANAPGHQVAHRSYVINMADPLALRELIEKEKPHWVVPEIEAIATTELMALESEGKITVTPTARAAWLTMNREGIRRLAAEELNQPTSAYRFADTFEELKQGAHAVGFPCLIKPVMSSSGKGQSKVDSPAELQAAWEYAQSGGRVDMGRVIVEGFIRFDYEITLLTVRHFDPNGQIATSFCEPIGHVQVQGDYVESWQPQQMNPLALVRAQTMAKQVTSALGGLGLFGVELFVAGDHVWFSEVSPRPHDTGMVTMATQHLNEFELHARAILGLPINTALRNPGASAVIYGGVKGTDLEFDGLTEALSDPEVDIRLFGKPESFVKRRMGVALARGEDTDSARRKAKSAARAVRVTAHR